MGCYSFALFFCHLRIFLSPFNMLPHAKTSIGDKFGTLSSHSAEPPHPSHARIPKIIFKIPTRFFAQNAI